MDHMTMSDWAKREVEIATSQDAAESGDAYEYAKGCFESALKAFESLCEDNHSGVSMGLTKDILNRLIDRKPLTPVYDNSEDWIESWKSTDGIKHYQHRRCHSLFKDIYPDGHAEFNDVEAYAGYEQGSNIPYHGGSLGKVLYEYFPIDFPYYPPTKKYKIIMKTVLSDPKNGDFDTKMYMKIIRPDGVEKRINRYFGEVDGEWNEISKEEFDKRYQMEKEWRSKNREN